jgi:hypothetical protein
MAGALRVVDNRDVENPPGPGVVVSTLGAASRPTSHYRGRSRHDLLSCKHEATPSVAPCSVLAWPTRLILTLGLDVDTHEVRVSGLTCGGEPQHLGHVYRAR